MFTRARVTRIRIEMQEALDKVAKKYNSTANIGNIKFGETIEAKFNISPLTQNEYGVYIKTKESIEFINRQKSFGFTRNVLNEPLNIKEMI